MSQFGTYLCSGVTVQYDFGTTGEKKRILLCSVSFHLFWTDSNANYNILHLDVKILIINTNTFIKLCYIMYTIYFVFIVSVHK